MILSPLLSLVVTETNTLHEPEAQLEFPLNHSLPRQLLNFAYFEKEDVSL